MVVASKAVVTLDIQEAVTVVIATSWVVEISDVTESCVETVLVPLKAGVVVAIWTVAAGVGVREEVVVRDSVVTNGVVT